MIDRLLTTPCTILVRQSDTEDEYGDRTYKVVRRGSRCAIQAAGSREDHEHAVQVSSWQVWLPADTADVRGWDAVEADGAILELNGDPQLWKSPLTGVSFMQGFGVRLGFTSSTIYDELDEEFVTYADMNATGDTYAQVSPQDEWSGPI
jgi:hypothetical protein